MESLSKKRRMYYRAFLRTPSALIAEPFEVFLVVLAMLDAGGLLLRHFLHDPRPEVLDSYHGETGLLIWASVMTIASVLLCRALVKMQHISLLNLRKLEITGMWIYAAGFSYYGYGNLAAGLRAGLVPIQYLIINEVIICMLVIACAVRAISLSSYTVSVAVARVHRVKLMKDEIRRILAAQEGHP